MSSGGRTACIAWVTCTAGLSAGSRGVACMQALVCVVGEVQQYRMHPAARGWRVSMIQIE